MHFCDMSTSKSGPTLRCFVHFDLEMCFAPHRPFSTWQLPKVLRPWCALYILTWKRAPRHNALFRHFNFQKCSEADVLCTFVHFDFKMCFAPQRRAIFHLSSGQMAPHPPLFDLPELPNWKNMVTWGLEALTKSTFSAAAYH